MNYFHWIQLALIILKLAQVGLIKDLSWWLVMMPTLILLGIIVLGKSLRWMIRRTMTEKERDAGDLKEAINKMRDFYGER